MENVDVMEIVLVTKDGEDPTALARPARVSLDLAPTTELATAMELVLVTTDGLMLSLNEKSVIAQLSALEIALDMEFVNVVFANVKPTSNSFLIALAKNVMLFVVTIKFVPAKVNANVTLASKVSTAISNPNVSSTTVKTVLAMKTADGVMVPMFVKTNMNSTSAQNLIEPRILVVSSSSLKRINVQLNLSPMLIS